MRAVGHASKCSSDLPSIAKSRPVSFNVPHSKHTKRDYAFNVGQADHSARSLLQRDRAPCFAPISGDSVSFDMVAT